jgi:hypothetical protein
MKEMPVIPSLQRIHANILYMIKYKTALYPECFDLLDLESTLTLIQENTELFAAQCNFMDSVPLFFASRAINPEDHDDKPIVDIQQYTANINSTVNQDIGYTLFTLINFGDFPILYCATLPNFADMTYHTRYFDDYMFQGNNLFGIVNGSVMFGLIESLTSTDIFTQHKVETVFNRFATMVNAAHVNA